MSEDREKLKEWAKGYVSTRVFDGRRPIPKEQVDIMRAAYWKRQPWWKRLFKITW